MHAIYRAGCFKRFEGWCTVHWPIGWHRIRKRPNARTRVTSQVKFLNRLTYNMFRVNQQNGLSGQGRGEVVKDIPFPSRKVITHSTQRKSLAAFVFFFFMKFFILGWRELMMSEESSSRTVGRNSRQKKRHLLSSFHMFFVFVCRFFFFFRWWW